MDFRNTPVGDAIFFAQKSASNPCKKQAAVWKIKFSHCCFFFLPVIFAISQKWDCSLTVGCLALLDLRSSLLRLAAGLRPLRRIPLEMPGSPENLPAAAVEPPRRSGFAHGNFQSIFWSPRSPLFQCSPLCGSAFRNFE